MKTALEVLVATLLMIVVSLPFLIIMFIVRLDGGPAFYRHKRVGAGGREFNCLKFRTMVLDADRVLSEVLARDCVLADQWARTRKLANDPRITRVGRFLRNSSLDELPQLINVLRLEMSLVGPRPIVESEIPLYGEGFAHYCAVRPGMTGLWQVSGRSKISYEKRVELDMWYVDNWSLWKDIVVLLKTIPTVLCGEGAY
jgi:Undecaprenyl-phosphate galactose phosphotransferase WbaP